MPQDRHWKKKKNYFWVGLEQDEAFIYSKMFIHSELIQKHKHWERARGDSGMTEGTALSCVCAAQSSRHTLGLWMYMSYAQFLPVPHTSLTCAHTNTYPPCPSQCGHSSCILIKANEKGKWEMKWQGLRHTNLPKLFCYRQGTVANASFSEKEATISFSNKARKH